MFLKNKKIISDFRISIGDWSYLYNGERVSNKKKILKKNKIKNLLISSTGPLQQTFVNKME